jgi:hypothetical protein
MCRKKYNRFQPQEKNIVGTGGKMSWLGQKKIFSLVENDSTLS